MRRRRLHLVNDWRHMTRSDWSVRLLEIEPYRTEFWPNRVYTPRRGLLLVLLGFGFDVHW